MFKIISKREYNQLREANAERTATIKQLEEELLREKTKYASQRNSLELVEQDLHYTRRDCKNAQDELVATQKTLQDQLMQTQDYSMILQEIQECFENEVNFDEIAKAVKELKEDYATATEAWGHNFKKLDEECQLTKASLKECEAKRDEYAEFLLKIRDVIGYGYVPFEALIQEIETLKFSTLLDGKNLQEWYKQCNHIEKLYSKLQEDFFQKKDTIDTQSKVIIGQGQTIERLKQQLMHIGDMEGTIEKQRVKNVEYERLLTRACIEICYYRNGHYIYPMLSGYLTKARYGHLNEEIVCERKRLEAVVLGQNKSKKTVKMNAKTKK